MLSSLTYGGDKLKLLAISLVVLVAAYVLWKITQSPNQALQFTFNGLSVGAVYALLAMGFTIVYSTVWFFDLYYGAAAALGAYGVFYLMSQYTLGGIYHVNLISINVLFALIVAGVVMWALHTAFHHRTRNAQNRNLVRGGMAIVAGGAGVYVGFVLAYPEHMHVILAPAVGLLTVYAVAWVLHNIYRRLFADASIVPFLLPALILGGALGAGAGFLLAGAPSAKLYLSWAVSTLLAGTVGLAMYRGLYVYMRERARSPLVMLVASLGILLTISAFIIIVFQSTARPLPDPFGIVPWTIGGANIKPFNVFTIGVALAGFAGLLLLLQKTSFGRAARAIGDDEEVSKVVGINTTVIIAVVFFIGAAFAAMAGILSGHDTSIQPRMGLLLLLKGWVASVVGGIGNLYGAIVGGFALGMVEQFGIWDLAGEWKDAISFIVLIVFLSFWPNGLLPRR